MKNFIKNGDTLTFVATADIVAGAGFLLNANGFFAVNSYDVVTGQSGEARVKGVFSLPKTVANAPDQFATAYWNDTTKRVTTTATGNTKIGVFAKAAVNGDAVADVKLLPAV
ncbi:DUF2190 family protein [Exilibacterium tricleocarpae]|uniref:DUF2190 family protein n=1 Tax=Exilibacterium tricleocarpae TaxID=2591008 RepID=A0A545U6U8_9GAMM|nr:capsid cement protein [Exilibacterium tricleocarpae]TQV85198.1 DUF2190 family protein [Exilibacterium tricleocarpae]